MKKVLLPFLLIMAPLVLSAQDTVRVQTFDWNSTTRAQVFEFPDDPNDSYRKIIMKYNMRCHDAAVGSGNVGCREWDYSCNTFITDSTRVDSTRQTHPSHVISNFSGGTFYYTSSPTSSYTMYPQHQTSLDLSNENEAAIGSGETDLYFSGSQPTLKAQFLFTAEELQDAGLIAGAIQAFKLTPKIYSELDFLRIQLRATTDSALNARQPILDGFTEVYFSDTEFFTGGDQTFNFYQPYEWDGTSNLIVQFSYNQTTNAAATILEGSETDFDAAIFSNFADSVLHLQGISEIAVPTDHISNISEEITIALWAHGIPEIMPANSTVFEGVDNAGNRQANVHLPWGNGQVFWDCGNNGSGYDRINKQANEADFEGDWNHWAFTKNVISGEMKIYLNGELWHSGTSKHNLINITAFDIGASISGSLHYYGSIAEFEIWNKELDQATIKEWMHDRVRDVHPDYDHLVVYYPLDQAAGNVAIDLSPNQTHGAISFPNWQPIRGKDRFKYFLVASIRPDITFLQGDAVRVDSLLPTIDQLPNVPNSVVQYGLNGTDLIITDTQYLYQAGYHYVFSEIGEIVDSVWVAPEDSLLLDQLTYFTKQPSKYEILSLVTPYGNSLDLGDEGKTFTFDVTDYAPILKGKRRMSIEMGGQWQEELDIEFLFIKGTPAREVLDIQNLWPFRRGNYDEIQADRFFEPRTVALDENGVHYKLRSAVTGHGQNGEFIPRTHYLNLNGGNQDFTYDVWKECADNPIYPQGGTWIFDRAGWCPGAATDIHEFEITPFVNQGGEVEIDYGVNGPFMSQANYLVSNQLVTYGTYNFNVDASLERIARPNNTDVEFERINPACSLPIIWVKNTGKEKIESLEIEYFVKGNAMIETFEWTGEILSDEVAQIELPVLNMGFWNSSDDEGVFEAIIKSVNGAADEYAVNDHLTSHFEPVDVFQNDQDYVLSVRTNNNGEEYSYVIKNAAGEIVMQRDSMLSNTTYDDMLSLPPGCYTMQFFDASHDGLSFWFFPENGNGTLGFKRYLTPTFLLTFKSFDPDFGSGVQYDFVVEEVVSIAENQKFQAISAYPNPTSGQVNVELRGFAGQEVSIEITNLQGQQVALQKLQKVHLEKWDSILDLDHLPQGMYFINIQSDKKVWTREIVKF